jgi:hypothetical protein
MTENVENLILEHLRAIRATQSEHGERLTRIEIRLGVIETRLSAVETRLADLEVSNQKRLDRIERRLELHEESP